MQARGTATVRGVAQTGKTALMYLFRGLNRWRALTAPPPSTHRVRILLLHANGMGGTIRTVFNQASYLAATGHDVEIVSILREAEQPFFPLDPRVRLRYLDDRTVEHTGLSARLAKKPSRLVPEKETAYHRFSLRTDIELARYLRSLRDGVLMATRPGLNLVMAQLTPPGVITVGQEHVAYRTQAKSVQKLIKRRYRRFDALVTLTKADMSDYRKALTRKPGKMARIPNAVPPMTGAPARLDSKVAVAVGRLTRIKGFDRLVTAWQEVAEQHPDWTLRIYGAGPQKANLATQIADLGLTGKVQLMGATKDVGAALAEASVYVLSSRHEGFPMTILEAMAKGMAIVSFASPHGPLEMITHESDGLLVEPRTEENLAAAVNRVIENDRLRADLAAGALRTAENYSVEAVGAQWDDLFDELLARRDGNHTEPAEPAEAADSTTPEPAARL